MSPIERLQPITQVTQTLFSQQFKHLEFLARSISSHFYFNFFNSRTLVQLTFCFFILLSHDKMIFRSFFLFWIFIPEFLKLFVCSEDNMCLAYSEKNVHKNNKNNSATDSDFVDLYRLKRTEEIFSTFNL